MATIKTKTYKKVTILSTDPSKSHEVDEILKQTIMKANQETPNQEEEKPKQETPKKRGRPPGSANKDKKQNDNNI
jgi:hypothetical protein